MVERMVGRLRRAFVSDTIEPCRECGAYETLTLQGPDLRAGAVADFSLIGGLIIGRPLCFDCIARESQESRAEIRAVLPSAENESCRHCGLEARTKSGV